MSAVVANAELSTLISLVRQVCVDLPPAHTLAADSRFIEDIGMQSVNRLMLMTLVEGEFGVSLERHVATLVELKTLGETADFISAVKAGS